MIKNLNYFDKIAVVEFDLLNTDYKILVDESYKMTLIVFRYEYSVIGQLFCKVNSGVVSIPDIEELTSLFYETLWENFQNNKIRNYSPLVSVIVCSHNRTEDLKKCLESLNNLAYPNKEIIVVDNAPENEETKKLVLSFNEYIYVNESKKGLDRARNRGIKEARGEIIAYTDDDAVVDRFWLNGIVNHFRYPLVAVVTGVTMPLELETKAQIIFEQTNGFNRGFIKKEYSITNLKPVGSGKAGAGVNMAIRKRYIDDIGLFDESLDGGTYTLSGGDQEFFYRVLSKGYKIVYEPGALVWHKHRKDMKSLKKTIYGYGVGVFAWWTKIIFRDKEFASIFFICKWFIFNYIFNIIKSPFKPGSTSLQLSLLEFCGTLYGPVAYFKSCYSLNSTPMPKSKIN